MTTTVATPEPVPAVEPVARIPLHRRVRRLADWLTILVFGGVLGVPLFGTFFRPQPPLDENRPRHPPPPFALKKPVLQDYPKWFDLYFGDRVGYRDVLLGWHHAVVYHAFGQAVSDRGWVGRDGWFFLNVDDPERGKPNAPGVDARIAAWADALADRHAYLKARGIEYVVFAPPDKSSVYPEHLPGYFARHPPPAAGGRLAELLAERGVRCVDPLPALLTEKERAARPLYYRKDSHWNPAGARVGYRLLFDELARGRAGLVPHPDDGFRVVGEAAEGDLGRLVGAPPEDRAETLQRAEPVGRAVAVTATPPFAAALPPEAKNPALPPRQFTCAAAAGPPVVFFHDSFGQQLMPYLVADFRSVATVAVPTLDVTVVEAVNPQVVVQQLVARRLYLEAPVNPPEVRGYSKR
jgi:hypothetical protein